MGEVGDEDEVEKLKKRVLAMRAHRDVGMASPGRLPARYATTGSQHSRNQYLQVFVIMISSGHVQCRHLATFAMPLLSITPSARCVEAY